MNFFENYFLEIKKNNENLIPDGYSILKKLEKDFKQSFNNIIHCKISSDNNIDSNDYNLINKVYYWRLYDTIKYQPFITLIELSPINPYPLIFNGYGFSSNLKIIYDKIINDDKELIKSIEEYLDKKETINYISYFFKIYKNE